MNRDLQTCLHVLESGSVDQASLYEVLQKFCTFSGKTEYVAQNRSDTAAVYCRILSACQNLYEIDSIEKLPEEIKNLLILCFNNIERLFLEIQNEECHGTYVRIIWFLSALKTKAVDGRAGEINKEILGEYARDLLEILGGIRFIFDIQQDGKQIFPISRVIASVISGRNFQEFRGGVQINDVYTLQLAVRLFKATEDTNVLEELKNRCNLQFINYLKPGCQVIDTVDFLNYQCNGTMIFYNSQERKVLIRSEHEEYFIQECPQKYTAQSERDYDGNEIGQFIEYELDKDDSLCDYSTILENEQGRIALLKLIYDEGFRNIFLQKSIIHKANGTIVPVNPFCGKDSHLVQGYLNRGNGKAYLKDNIRSLLQKYRICSVRSRVMNRVTFGLCLLLLEIKNTGVQALGLDSLVDTNWYQAQVIQNWIGSSDVDIEDIKRLLQSWYEQLQACEKISLVERLNVQAMDFLPLKQELECIYQKICPGLTPDERLFSGTVIEKEEEPDEYEMELASTTVAAKNAKKQECLPRTIESVSLLTEDETLEWEQCLGSVVFFFYSIDKGTGHVPNREISKSLSGVELIQENCFHFEIGVGVSEQDYESVCSRMKLFEPAYAEIAKRTKVCLSSDFESQAYLRLLYNMVWSKIDSIEKRDDYFSIIAAHQIVEFEKIDEDDFFNRRDPATLYVPKDKVDESSVLSNIYEKRLKTETHRDERHLYESDLSKNDDDAYTIHGNRIERVVFLTDNMASGKSTLAALAAYLGIQEDTDFQVDADRVRQADAKRHKYYCENQEISISDVLTTNEARITVHAYYGTEAARQKICDFLKKHVEVQFDNSTYEYPLTMKADDRIIERAHQIWGKHKGNIKSGHYLYIREYNMPKCSIFPSMMLEQPMLMINLFCKNRER